jgi:hypothetical protein
LGNVGNPGVVLETSRHLHGPRSNYLRNQARRRHRASA